MQHQDGFFKGVRNSRIFYQAWLPEGEPKAALLIVHGLAEHCGRYANVVNHLVPRGYAAYGLDHIGHGKSEGTRVYVERFSDYTVTLKTFFDMVRGWQPGKPIYLLGHSMGGLIGAAYLLDHQDELAGAVLSAPSVKVPEDIPPPLVAISRLISLLAPKASLVGLDATGISRDPEVVAAYVADPLVHTGKYTARLGAELLRAMRRVEADANHIRLPLLVVQGSADRLVPPAGARMLYDAVSSRDKRLIVYDGFYHEVHNEPERARVLADLEEWLEAHTSTS